MCMRTTEYLLCSSTTNVYLSLRQTEAVSELFPLGSDYIMVLLEGSLQAQQLRGRERGADPLGLPRERSV